MRAGYLDRRGPDPVLIECPDCLSGLAEVYTAGRCCGEACDCTTVETCGTCSGSAEVRACARCESRPSPGDGLLCATCELAVELELDLDAYRADLQLEMRRAG